MKSTPILLAAACLVASFGARAESFSVSPARVEFTAQRQMATVQVVNTGVEPLSLQASAVRWPALPNAIAPDAAPLVFEPAIVHVAPGKRQTVRVAVFDREPASAERRYSLRFTPLPTHRELETVGPASTATPRISLPVVIAAAGVVHPVRWGRLDTLEAAKAAPAPAERKLAKASPAKRPAAKTPKRAVATVQRQRTSLDS